MTENTTATAACSKTPPYSRDYLNDKLLWVMQAEGTPDTKRSVSRTLGLFGSCSGGEHLAQL